MRPLLTLLFCWTLALPAAAVDYVAQPALPLADPAQAQVLDFAWAGERLVAVGERGLVMFSDDAGVSWTQARVPLSQTLTAVSFPVPEQGWAVGHGGVILHSGDSGESWQLQFDGQSANQQWLGYSRGREAMLRERLAEAGPGERDDIEYALEDIQYEIEDTELALETGPADPFLDVWFADDHQGWAVGAYGLLFTTNNGGLQWKLAVSGIENRERYHYYRLSAGDNGQLYLAGEAGILYRSDDRGVSWQRLPLEYDGSLFGVIALAHGEVLCFGLRGNIFRSVDGGQTWQAVNPEPDPGLSFYGGERLGESRVILVGAGGGMAISRDGGQSFSSDVHSSRNTFSTVTRAGKDLLLGGMGGVVRIRAARQP